MRVRNKGISEDMKSEVDKGAENLRPRGRIQPGGNFFADSVANVILFRAC